ncbi:MAG: porin [Betaproteobacteria bacterium]|nr:porin [Betaproteobacteria bacterium]
MQEKLIALSVAGLLAAPVFAQSGITVYGLIDYGYVSLGSSSKGHAIRNAIDSGISSSNRIGFKGTEDLDNALKAMFVLEQGLTGDTGPLWNAGQARQFYASLASGFGTVAFGRQTIPQHNFTDAVDPFGKDGLGSAANVLMQDMRMNNLATYTSPDFGGFRFILGYTFNASTEKNLENNGDIRVWVIAPSLTWDKLFVAANYHSAKRNNAHGDSPNAYNVFDLYASYDFGFIRLGGMVGRRTTNKGIINIGTQAAPVTPDKDSKLTQWMIGATFEITPNDLALASYGRAAENNLDGNGKRAISQWAIGYEHALSKRTVVYSQFAMQNHNAAFNDAGVFYTYRHDSTVGSVACSNLNTGCDALYRRGFAVGFRHSF